MSDTLNTVVLGVGVVFAGLIAIIILCKITSAICMATQKSKKPAAEKVAPVTAPAVIENRQEIIAAVSAVIAEELGSDISAIRIHSFKKI